MRPFETTLVFANTLVLLLLMVPLPDAAHWMRHFAPVVLFIAAAQIVMEGQRWQMLPAYVLAGLFSVVWLLQNIGPADWLTGHVWITRLAIGIGALGLAISIALPLLVPVFRFPRPTGAYAIGTLTYHWVDAGRQEAFTTDPNARRELMVQVWYPAKGDLSSPRAPYVEDARVLTPLARLLHLPPFIFGHVNQITTNAVPSAPVADGAEKYPVLLFSHGNGGFREHNTWEVEELVSHGYIVAAVDHTYAASGVLFPDGRLVPMDRHMTNRTDRTFEDSMLPHLAQDALFTLNQLTVVNQSDPNSILTGKLDLQHAGIFGVSMGGEISALACRQEPRLQACLIMDVWMPADVVADPMKQPTMWITRDAKTMRLEHWREADIDETLTTMRETYEHQPGAGYFVQVPGMFHLDFSDAPLLSPLTSWLGVTGPIDGERAHAITSGYALAFFDRHLKDLPAPLLDGTPKEYPEVRFESRRGSSR